MIICVTIKYEPNIKLYGPYNMAQIENNDIRFKVLGVVDAALPAGDYDFSISKGNRKIKSLFIQDETLMTEFR